MAETVAVFDVGSNSVKMLVARIDEGTFATVDEEIRTTRLAKGLHPGRPLGTAGMDATFAALKDFRDRAKAGGATQAFAAGTQALRIAADADAFVARIRRDLKIRLSVLTGEEEAEISFLGATADVPGREHAVVDIGGGSTEFVVGANGRVVWARSLPVGAVPLTERFLRSDPPQMEETDRLQVHLGRMLAPIDEHPLSRRAALILVGGTASAAAAAASRHEGGVNPSRIHGLEFAQRDLVQLHQRLLRLSSAERKRLPGMDPERADILPAGLQILLTALDRWGRSRVRISSRGLRHGLVIQRMRGLR